MPVTKLVSGAACSPYSTTEGCTSLPPAARGTKDARSSNILIYLATESCNSECSHFTASLPNLAASLSLSRRRIKKEGERGKGELIDAWAERRRRGPIRARPIEKEGDRNCDLHNSYPELRVPLISGRLEIGVERAKFKIVSSSLLASLAKFRCSLPLSLTDCSP